MARENSDGRTFQLVLSRPWGLLRSVVSTSGHNRFLRAGASDIHTAFTRLEGILVGKKNDEVSCRDRLKKSTQACGILGSCSCGSCGAQHARTAARTDRLRASP